MAILYKKFYFYILYTICLFTLQIFNTQKDYCEIKKLIKLLIKM